MEFTCTICLVGSKQKGHIMCSVCKEAFEKSVLKMLESQKSPETLFQYAERMTQENLNKYRAEFEDLETSLDAFWEKACKEIKFECRGIRLSKANFLTAVKVRYRFLIKMAHDSKYIERMESLKKTVRILEKQLDWFAKIKQQKRIKAEKKENAVA